MERRFRLVIFSSAPPSQLQHFLRRLSIDLPEVEIGGILYEARRKHLRQSKRIKRFLSLIGERDFLRFVIHNLSARFKGRVSNLFDDLLRWVHACPRDPNGPPVTLRQLAQDCASKNISFHIVDDIHDPQSLAFVRALDPAFGVIFGTRILKPELFSIPEQGSINIHKHKLPDYRGSGAPGIWEMRDGKEEVTVTVHRVVKDVDAGAILGECSFSIDPLDTLFSVGLKADLLSIDLLIDVVRAESRGLLVEVPQSSAGTVYKGFQPHQLFAIGQSIREKRIAYRPIFSRPFYKLVLRTLTYPVLFFRNQRRRRERSFPIIILFHHLITDKPKSMGLATEQFAKQIRFLKKHYKIASLSEALDALRKGEVAMPTVALTFDDGYAENFLCLRAVAEAENVPVTLFVCTQHVLEGSGFRHDLNRGEVGFPALNWEQVRYLDRHGVTIGSHTRNHFDCGSTDVDALIREIVGSRDDLVRELGRDVPFFAFPKGHEKNMSGVAKRLAKQAYEYTFSAFGGVNHAPLLSSHMLYRCSHPDSIWELELLAQSVLEVYPKTPFVYEDQPSGREKENISPVAGKLHELK